VTLCLASAVVDGLVAICDRPEDHRPAKIHYAVHLDLAWTSAEFGRPVRAALGEAERREAGDAYRRHRRDAGEAGIRTEMTG
jgi:hypothetical protein